MNFIQNVTKIHRKLPLLPSELDVILLKPAAGSKFETRAIKCRFEKVFRVKRANIQIWLNYLEANHPDYRDVIILSSQFIPSFFPDLSCLMKKTQVHQTLPSETMHLQRIYCQTTSVRWTLKLMEGISKLSLLVILMIISPIPKLIIRQAAQAE